MRQSLATSKGRHAGARHAELDPRALFPNASGGRFGCLGIVLIRGSGSSIAARSGQVAEWFKAAVLKTAVGATPPWVRIPPCPPHSNAKSVQGPRLGPFFFLFQRALAGPSALRRLRARRRTGPRLHVCVQLPDDLGGCRGAVAGAEPGLSRASTWPATRCGTARDGADLDRAAAYAVEPAATARAGANAAHRPQARRGGPGRAQLRPWPRGRGARAGA